MTENENSKGSVRLTEVNQHQGADREEESQDRLKKFRKPLIFGLMAVVFVGCMYLIFIPATEGNEDEKVGLNEAVPQATDIGMQGDKGKAYESEIMEEKELAKKKSLSALSEYWNADSTGSGTDIPKQGASQAPAMADHQNQALNSYRNIQGTLGSFYEDKGETTQLQNEVRSLKSQLAQKETVVQNNPVESQLALMEKSYQLAAKYFPTTASTVKPEQRETATINDTVSKTGQKSSFAAFYPLESQVVSALQRRQSDIDLSVDVKEKNRNFNTATKQNETYQTANSIRACVHETQTIIAGGMIRIRLLSPFRIKELVIPKGTILTGIGKFQGTRLQIQVSSVEFQGSIVPVEISVYDRDGQLGLAVPVTAERSAITETIANMGNTSGTSVSLSSSAGQQITTDLSKSLVQGISGYFSKKVRTPKITLKAGYQLFLLSKK